jgi:hypothetical protein
MTMRNLALEAVCIAAILFGVVPPGSSTAALAQSSAPAPKNLSVTGVTDWTVALKWDTPKGKAPSSYVVQCSNGRNMMVAGSQTDGATEAMVFWGNSTDNVTPQEHIRYYLYLNGQFDGATVDPYPHQFTMYLTLGIVNTIEVYAVDEAGNRSAPATMTIDLRAP